MRQPPSGGCVLKHVCKYAQYKYACQPPSGGCVLKPLRRRVVLQVKVPAAFGRLCVETEMSSINRIGSRSQPPSGGCVLKPK